MDGLGGLFSATEVDAGHPRSYRSEQWREEQASTSCCYLKTQLSSVCDNTRSVLNESRFWHLIANVGERGCRNTRRQLDFWS